MLMSRSQALDDVDHAASVPPLSRESNQDSLTVSQSHQGLVATLKRKKTNCDLFRENDAHIEVNGLGDVHKLHFGVALGQFFEFERNCQELPLDVRTILNDSYLKQSINNKDYMSQKVDKDFGCLTNGMVSMESSITRLLDLVAAQMKTLGATDSDTVWENIFERYNVNVPD